MSGEARARLSLPKRVYIAGRRWLRRVVRVVQVIAAKVGRWRVECPICGWRFRSFLPHGLVPRPNARCPRCDSLERQRLLYLYLRHRTGFFGEPLRVLHFAPEPVFASFRSLPNLELVTADLAYPTVDVNLDITRLPMRDDTFDVVLCSHVLEHVPDDRAAMREIARVLRPGGWAALMVPFDRARPETFEDRTVTDPAERERLFGQVDHVRVYGTDFADRLREEGFDVTEEELAPELDRARYGVLDEPVHVCVKPAASEPAAVELEQAGQR